ncbi:MAG: YbfB/YjiJ family MFS transporter [Rhizobiaceae bacterium]|nr:YbfB/YjiJ family MFS transporter [Rhizobiaceae bacterium]
MLNISKSSKHMSVAGDVVTEEVIKEGELLAHQTRNFTFAGLAMVAVTFGLARYGFGLFVPDISRDLSLSPDVIGLIAGSSYIGYLCATLSAAGISRHFGPRVPIVLGGVTAGLGMLLVGFSETGLGLLIAIFIAGTSPGLSYPPFSEVIVRQIYKQDQERTYAWINSGTGFGVAVAGPIVLFSAFDWRSAYMIFAGLALLVSIWNFSTIRTDVKDVTQDKQPSDQRVTPLDTGFAAVIKCAKARPLFVAALGYGLASSAYWTFAVDLLYDAGDAENTRIIFWSVLGTAGIFGFLAGWLTSNFGLRGSYCALMVVTAVSIGALPMIATSNYAIFASSAVFGLGFIVTTAFLGMWSLRIFDWAPATGFAITFFLISLGQGIGPVLIGLCLRNGVEMDWIFGLCGLLCLALAFIIPPRADRCPIDGNVVKRAKSVFFSKN